MLAPSVPTLSPPESWGDHVSAICCFKTKTALPLARHLRTQPAETVISAVLGFGSLVTFFQTHSVLCLVCVFRSSTVCLIPISSTLESTLWRHYPCGCQECKYLCLSPLKPWQQITSVHPWDLRQ